MRFPSLSSLYTSFIQVVQRFPVPLLFAVAATVSGMFLIDNEFSSDTQNNLIRMLYMGNIGLALSFAIKMYQERNPEKKGVAWLAYGLLLLILACVFLFLEPFFKEADILMVFIIAFAAHLLVSIAAFHQEQEAVGFWQVNKTFFLRFATSALYSAVLFVGLSVALLSIDQLFKVDLDDAIYGRLWAFIAGIFNTVFFLAGIPKPLSALNQQHDYPKGLKVFTQFVLIPLATIYLLILLAYELKILLDFELPTSSVAVLILGYAVFGILSLLLVHPLREQEGNAWIKWYSKSFYLLMLPLIVLLILSIYKRVGDYGITESRYVLIALCIWLCFITGFFLIKGQEQIRVIPISLVVICILAVVGPWNLTAVSRQSQQNRLERLLAQQKSNERNDEIRSVVHYLNDSHGMQSLQPFVKTDLKKLEERLVLSADTSSSGRYQVKWKSRDTLLSLMNIPKYPMPSSGLREMYYFKNKNEGVLDVAGAEKVIEFISTQTHIERSFTVNNSSYTLAVDTANQIRLNQEVVFKADSTLNRLLKKYSGSKSESIVLKAEELTFQLRYQGQKVRIVFDQLNGGYEQKKPQMLYFTGYVVMFPKE